MKKATARQTAYRKTEIKTPARFTTVVLFIGVFMTGLLSARTTDQVPAVSAATLYCAPVTPLEMALKVERELARGAGILMPDPDRPVRLNGGLIPLEGKSESFPPGFLSGLTPEKVNGVEVWRVTLCADDTTGTMVFYNGEGDAFWTVEADASVYTPDWVARIRSPDGKADVFFDLEDILAALEEKTYAAKLPEEALYRAAWLAARQYLLPSHLEVAFTFILEEDADAYVAAESETLTLAAVSTQSASDSLTGLAVTGISVGTNGVSLSAGWPASSYLTGNALDVFFSETLSPPAWTNLLRVTVDVATNTLEIAVPRALLPPAPETPPPAYVTNIVQSSYDPGVLVTNIICTNAVWVTESGFFRLADLSDTDGDGLTDAMENFVTGTSPELSDTDSDGLLDGEEVILGTDPLNPDSDGDGMEDGWEADYGLDPLDPSDGFSDDDNDGLTFAEEYNGTFGYDTDPDDWDTDGDGLSDGDEILIGTNPLERDSDADGLEDRAETEAGTDPNNTDTDNDGLEDGWEAAHDGYDPLDPSDGVADPDDDGLSNADEVIFGTDPNNSDTDDDGLEDGEEINGGPGTDPTDADTDGDGLEDGEEIALGTSPLDNDSDNDGCPDGWETDYGFDPLDSTDPLLSADPDGDHIPNWREAVLGTNPSSADTDNDGLDDNMEAGGVSPGLSPFAVSGGTNVLALMDDPDCGDAVLPLPFPVAIQGVVCSNLFIDVNGFIELGQSAADGYLSDCQLELDAFYDDLKAYPTELGSTITLADVATNGVHYCIVEYKNMSFWSGGATASNLVSFQIVFQEGVSDRADVVFTAAAGRGDGRYATLEARTSLTTVRYARHQTAVYPGLTLAYGLGTGTDPCSADSDGDGISDADEIVLGTDPLQSDTDGDGLSDGFELAHAANGMDPLLNNDDDSIEDNGADEDADGDGLTNAEEEDAGTDPYNDDSDGDGVKDGDEEAQGSDPLDSADNQPRTVVPVTLFFGDESGSHSEKYRVVVTPVSGDSRPARTLTNHAFGQPDPLTLMLVANTRYAVTLEHIATSPEQAPYGPDYDYTLTFTSDDSTPALAVVADDPDDILGEHGESDYFYADGKSVEITVVRAGLVPDRDRDREIGDADISSALFRLWINDDADTGDVAEDDSDLPGQSSGWRKKANFVDGRVNGHADLPDFFPVWLDIGGALAVLPSGGTVRIKLRHEGCALNFVTTSLSTNSAGSFLVSDVAGLTSAETRKITKEGVTLPDAFLSAIRADPSKGVILVEGREKSESPLVLELWREGKKMLEKPLPLRVAPVEEMFNTLSLRDGGYDVTQGAALPPFEATYGHVFFLHGFHVDAEGARAWGSEMFKRLWQSGSKARFHAVTWDGDLGAPDAAHYQENVFSAFETASRLKLYVYSVQSGPRVVMAHSLGNMVVSSAIADCGMTVDKYFMFNAAVAAEAFDASQWSDASDAANRLVHYQWRDCTNISWSAKFHEFFTGDASDDRRLLTWKSRFSSVPSSTELYNYYSTGDEVLELFSDTPNSVQGVEFWNSLTWGWFAWHKQETHKGRFDLIDPAATSWAGWGFEYDFTYPTATNATSTWTGNTGPGFVCFNSNPAQNEVVLFDELGAHPVFRRTPSSMFSSNITVAVQNELLARGIPALSGPTGEQSINIKDSAGLPISDRNTDMNAVSRPNDWGRDDDDFKKRWLHGDLKDMAFFYNFKLFEAVVIKGGLK